MRKTDNQFRRGSALLIVLGMLSFMVVSAVGFSVYMRQSRAPSSYLGRNVSARYLVKAALANAIEDLEGGFMSRYDIGIDSKNNPDYGYFYGLYDDSYPGVGSESSKTFFQYDDLYWTENGNFWFKRVFCPFGLLYHPKNETDAVDSSLETVPTLTLEALAYLPPALIDDVRAVSRLTRTAQWHSLPYSAGRYAYTCVNVSDLFDINKLRASEPRDSGLNRITLATLTSNSPGDPTAVEEGRAETLDTLLEQVENTKIGGNIVPFVSLADFNLTAVGSRYAPLMSYIGGTGNGFTRSSETANGLFITDTWFAGATNAANTVKTIDLGGVDGSGQPFKTAAFRISKKSFLSMQGLLNANVKDVFEKNLGGVGLTCLYDYLDSDSIPTSLALPTVEAVPMVVGVSPPVNLSTTFDSLSTENGSFQVNGYYIDSDGNRIATPVTIKRTAQLKGITDFGKITLPCVVTYPFKRMVTSRGLAVNNGYRVRGMLRVWLAPNGMGCRPATALSLRPEVSDLIQWGQKGDPVARNGVATFFSDGFAAGLSMNKFSTDVSKTEEAVVDAVLSFGQTGLQMPVFWEVKEEILQNMPGQTLNADASLYSQQPYYSLANLDNLQGSLRPLGVNGEIHADWTEKVKNADRNYDINGAYPNGMLPLTAALTTQYRLYAAVWVQILDSKENVVDMAPATAEDDGDWLNTLSVKGNIANRICGGDVPLLNFKTTTDLSFDHTLETAMNGQQDFKAWGALYAVDPRYNWAPEDWFSTSDATADRDKWMSHIGLNGTSSPLLGLNGRDRDIFMFVSDQEYLQSIGELQFLPVVSIMDGGESFPGGSFEAAYNGDAFSTRSSVDSANLLHRSRFWRTYTGYNNGDAAALDNLNPYNLTDGTKDITFTSGANAFKVNPYSEDDRVLSAAFVGTPYDFYVASTNGNQRQPNGQKNHLIDSDLIDFSTMKSTYAFGDSAIATLTQDDVLDIADTISTALRQNNGKDFEEKWEDLSWQSVGSGAINDKNNLFLGLTYKGGGKSYLHGVDRKFLFSYWRDCFANDQQLFLFFVRAEPCSVGGGASGGVSSAQLGGRAVALVWRDPNQPSTTTGGTRTDRASIRNREQFRKVKKDCAPHKTRVLFYHQFD